jgi:hypothetical protein
MGEQLHQGAEQKLDNIDLNVESEKNLERLRQAAKEVDYPTQEVHELQSIVEQKAVSGQEITIGEREAQSNYVPGLHGDLKQTAYKQTLNRARSQLSTPERNFSKLIHQPVVDKTSEVAAKTVFRPSGILGGALAALIGTSILTYFSRHYGFRYNYLFFGLLFIGGFTVGLVIEVMLRLLKKRS